MTPPITTVGDLRAALAAYPPDIPVRLALTPQYPQATTIGGLGCSPDDADLTGRGDPGQWERTLWIAEGTQIGYLPEIARDALGGPWTS